MRTDPTDTRDLSRMGMQIASIREHIRNEKRHVAHHMAQAAKLSGEADSDLRAVEYRLQMAQIHLANAKAYREGERRVTAGQTFTAAEYEQLVSEDVRRIKAEAASAYVKAASANRAPRVRAKLEAK